MATNTKVAFIGLGVMGFPMAGHVKNAGMDICVTTALLLKRAMV